MTDLKTHLTKLRDNLNILREREAKYGGNAPLELLNQIDDHKQAIDLTRQAITGELSEADWRKALRPLLVNIRDHSESQRDKNLSILIGTVRQMWVEDFLNSALLNAIYLDLGLQEKPNAVPQPFEELNIGLRRPEQDKQNLPDGTSAYDIYNQAGGSLLILGQPGSGKTTTLAVLARDLLAEAERDLTAPVPVIFNLSGWTATQKPLANWLEDELNRNHRVSRKLARRWLDEGRLALLLDSLDEVDENHRAACVKAINAYRASDATGPLVVCSRLQDYEDLQIQLELKQAIVLKKLTRSQVEGYFRRLQDRQPDGDLMILFERIWGDDALRELTQTPLMLNIITLTYAHSQAPPLPQGCGGSLRAQIFDAYSDYMFHRLGRTKAKLLHPKEQTLRYLRYFALQLQNHNLTEFSVGQIRASWLPRLRWLYRGLTWLIFGLLGGLIFGLSGGVRIGLIFGPVFGLVGGLFFGLSDKSPVDISWSWQSFFQPMVGSLLGGLLGGIIVGFLVEAGFVLPIGLALTLMIAGLIAGLMFGLIFGLRGGLSGGLLGGLMFGLFGGLIYRINVGPQDELVFRLDGGLLGGLIGGLLFGAVVGLFFGLFNGLHGDTISEKVNPNQEIIRSFRSFVIYGLLGGLFGELIVGPVVGPIVGLIYGGGFLIQHYLRLWMFKWHNLLPFKLIPFLNQAAELIFLQRLGGSYRFIHRSVQEYFAAQWKNNNEVVSYLDILEER